MKSKLILLLPFIGVLLCGISFASCKPGEEEETDNRDTTTVALDSLVEKTTPIEKMIVYVDASGSVKGYFSKGSDGRFANAIYNLAKYNNNSFPVYFWGDKTALNTDVDEKGGIITALQTKRKSGQDTYFNNIFEQMVGLVVDDSVEVACLVTDGIFGVANGLTENDTSAVTKRLNQFKTSVGNVFVDKDIAVSVYKLSAKLSGNTRNDAYITYQNGNVYPIEIENRPFYVIVIGKPEYVRDFSEHNDLHAELSLNFGTHNIEMHNSCQLVDLKHFRKGQWIGNREDNMTNLSMSFPSCLGDEKYLKNNTVVKFNGIDLKKDDDYVISGTRITITKDLYYDANAKKGANTFEVVVKNSIPEEWTNFYCEDDMDISNNQIVQGQTFGLKYLLEGILEGTKPGGDNLMEVKYEFTK